MSYNKHWLAKRADLGSEKRHYRGRVAFLTPREVERKYPGLSRTVLAKRRSLAIGPHYETVSGCVLYAEAEIEGFMAECAEAARAGAPQRCAIYVRADRLHEASDDIQYVGAWEAYAGGQRWRWVSTRVDFGPPSTSKDLRGGFRHLLEEATLHTFEVVLVPHLSHIATEATHLNRFLRKLARAGVTVHELGPSSAAPSPFPAITNGRVANALAI